uniref:RING-type domain-containing protein n=1 Tax=Sinocyclocheilus rhinocerous TaxID=307959 RepID=A0A673IG31_9TELE
MIIVSNVFNEVCVHLSDEYDNDPGVLRVELSCGHVADPMTLTDCCKAQLLNVSYQLNTFTVYMYIFCSSLYLIFLQCPGCGTFIERVHTSNLGVECLICTKRTGGIYKFCWQCLREWKGPQPCADQCENVGCNIKDQELLKDCSVVTLKYIQNVQCPAIRACPFCGVLIAHSNVGCKIMTCQKCHKEFCFLCLKPAQECLKTSTPYVLCTAEVAAKQVDVVRL